ncbi:MAG: protein kinase [Deltaproteobacteria bacterium]|nr:protein kinase [Deltaproteobacteria bacterium]
MPPTPIRLDDFDLLEVLGVGGMGTVWKGTHRPTGEDVAVKTLLPAGFADSSTRRALAAEIRSVAGLDHPNVVTVYDRGEVGPDDAAASGGRLEAQAPYLVMEYVAGGTLRDALGRVQWSRMRDLLLQVLAALAHAHARGLLHRDVKPDNVLLDAIRGQARLTDFGLARSLSLPEVPGTAVGTPEYMAPEQASGVVLEQGPPTDLYGVGCLAWALATGAPPFVGSPVAVLHAQREQALPAFRPLFVVPEGLDAWLERCLAKEPADRFPLAADAAAALCALDGLPTPAELGWRRRDDAPSVLHLRGAGSALYGLRSIPMVGRFDERDALWGALTEVADSKQPRAMVVRGPAGVGKSRLAQWLTERAEELGVARGMSATHGAQHGALDGLGPMLVRHLGAEGEGRGVIRMLLSTRLDPDTDHELLAGLTEIALPASQAQREAGVRATRFTRSEERYLLVERWLERVGRERPVVVWLDDAQWGIDAVAFARFILRQRSTPLPVLLVLTVRDEALSERLLEAALLDGLLSEERCDALPVASLDSVEHQSLVRGLLGLEDDLAARVEERTAGNPLFAVHLVGDWVQRRVLEAGDEGLHLREGVDVSLPRDLSSLWSGPLDSLLAGRPDDDRVAIELGAALGQMVDRGEWVGACEAAGVAPSEDLLASAASKRLVLPDAGQWAWAHGMLRETVLVNSADLAARHVVCARFLAKRLDDMDLDRVGEQWLAAGALDEAYEPFVTSGRRAELAGAQGRSKRAYDQARQVLEGLEVPRTDSRWLRWRYSLGVSETSGGNIQQGIALLRELVRDAEEAGDEPILLSAMDGLARARSNNGEPEAGLRIAQRALEILESTPEPSQEQLCIVLTTNAICSARCRPPEVGLAYARRAYAVANQPGAEAYNPASAGVTLGTALLHAKEYSEAQEVLGDTVAYAQSEGYLAVEVRALNVLGEVARYLGDLQGAIASYRRALTLSEARRPVGNALVRANLALLALFDGDLGSTRDEATVVLAMALGQRNRAMAFFANLMLLACEGADGDWDRWDARWAEVSPLLEEPFRESDVPRMIREAAKWSDASPARAATLRAAELRYWERHGTAAEKVEARARLT